jgi:DNA-binding NtrC family response regulator
MRLFYASPAGHPPAQDFPQQKLIRWVAQEYPDVVRIVLTGHATVDTAVRAINEGAVFRFFVKPCREFDLAMAIRLALEQRQQSRLSAQISPTARQ